MKPGRTYRKTGRKPLPFKGGDECRKVPSLPITIYTFGFINPFKGLIPID